MATLASFKANPEVVQDGVDRTTLSVTFRTDPALPGVQTTVDLLNLDGTVAGNVTVAWNGKHPEPTPVVRLASEATDGWRLDASPGRVIPKPSVVNEFEWVRDISILPDSTTTAKLIEPLGTIHEVSVDWQGAASPSTPSTPTSSGTPSSPLPGPTGT